MFEYLDHLKDNRVECYSVLLKMKIKDYLAFINKVYLNRGGIAGQRSPLKTKSAQRIRKRLVEDLKKETVIPPLVIGVRLTELQYLDFEGNIKEYFPLKFNDINNEEQISIIDGMQRTTALQEASQTKGFNNERDIRVEFWVSKSINSLIYRMLVLNSGQIPWSIKKQLEVVFSPLRGELESSIPGLKLYITEDDSSRSKSGEYQADQFIELFLLFAARRLFVDKQELVAEEFTRLDVVEASGNSEFMEMFYGVSELLVKLDHLFSKANYNDPDLELKKFKSGTKLFSSATVRAGFVVAIAQEIFGLPGIDYPNELQNARYKEIKDLIDKFIDERNDLDNHQLCELLDLPTLEQQTNRKTSKTGEFEREFFSKSFKTFIALLKENTFENFTPCWRTYS